MANSKRLGIANDPMNTIRGNWNEKSLLPVGWLFSIWLQLKYPSPTNFAMQSLHFAPQNRSLPDVMELAAGKAKGIIISDFAVISRGIQQDQRRFVSAEIKYSGQQADKRLSAAINSQLVLKQENAPPPGLSAYHTVIFVASPGIKDKTSLQNLEKTIRTSGLRKAGFEVPRQLTKARVVSTEDDGKAGAVYRLERKLDKKVDKLSSRYCWIWVCHYSLASKLLAKLVLGQLASIQTADDTDQFLMAPIYRQIDSNLLQIFESSDSSPLSDGLSNLLTDPLCPFANLVQFFHEPLVFLTNYYFDACRSSVTTLAEEKGGFTWNRLLYRLAEKEIGDRDSDAIKNWVRNTIPPMPLRIVERNQSGAVQADSVQVLLKTLQAPKIAVLEGNSGSGKSTLLEFIYITWLDGLQHAGSLSGQTELPLFLRLQLLKPEQIERLDKSEVLPEIFRLPLAAMAILKTSPVCLVIDAFDQIADNDDSIEQFGKLADLLQNNGFKISRIIISSRPLFRADLAMKKWCSLFETTGKRYPEPLIRVFQMMTPNEASRNAFIKAWLDFLSEIKDSEDQKQKLSLENFHQWLKQIVQGVSYRETGAVAFSKDSILSSPLLLSLALYVYVHKTDLKTIDIRSTSDLFENVVYATGDNRKSIETKRSGKWSATLKKLGELCWGHIANPENTLGYMFGQDTLWFAESDRKGKRKSRKQVLDELDAKSLKALNDLPFLTVHESGKSIEFVHPSFQEYFAASWLAGSFFKDDTATLPTVGGVQTTRLQGSPGLYEGNLGAFAETCLRLGREGFRFLLGSLYRETRVANDDTGRKRLEAFLQMMESEHCFQQYLYDAGFLDEAISELRLLSEKINEKYVTTDRTSKLVLNKLIAHTYYGRTDTEQKRFSRDELMAIDEAETEVSWLKLFAMDHVLNRYKKDEDLSPEFSSRIESFPELFREAEKRYQLNAENWRKIAIHPRAFEVTLRFGHYYGHLGNQTMGSPNEKDWHAGIDHFSRAILFRAVDARLSLTDKSFKRLAGIASDLMENEWYLSWLSKPHRRNVKLFEGFVGPSQAYGDTGQQYCARSHLHLNKFLFKSMCRPIDLKRAKMDQERAKALWQLALEPGGIDCSGGLKYFVYVVALDIRMMMVDDWIRKALGKLENYQNKTKRDLEEAESKIGFHYQQSRGIKGMVKYWHQQLGSAIS